MKKILVAGAGHGGLITAANLAKVGFDVTVIEQNSRNHLGYDWTDIFDIKAFESAGVPIPHNIPLEYKENMIFYTPTLRYFKKPNIPIKDREIKMERKKIYDILIDFAIKSGVKIIYETKIKSAIYNKERVLGIQTESKNYIADLVIDACGINSPVRCSLNKRFGIEKKIDASDQFYAYRAFYNRQSYVSPKEKYKVYLMPRKNKGICWVSTEDNFVDVLIGRFYPINEELVNEELNWLRKNNKIGDKKIRGGQFKSIPIRKPLSQIVCSGYAAIGDSAFMTIPLMGSGLATCAKAAKILTDVLIKKQNTNYEIQDLWEYQVIFYKKIGYDLAYKDILKCSFINMDSETIDIIFKNDIINDEILLDITNDKKLELRIKDILKQGKKGLTHPKILMQLSNTLIRCNRESKICKNIPVKYSLEEVEKWKDKYLGIKE